MTNGAILGEGRRRGGGERGGQWCRRPRVVDWDEFTLGKKEIRKNKICTFKTMSKVSSAVQQSAELQTQTLPAQSVCCKMSTDII